MILLALMDRSAPIPEIARFVDVDDRIVRANLIRMMHLGLVQTATLATVFSPFDDHRLRLWSLTRHARQHKQTYENCWACRHRLRYLAASEAIYE